jgi:predicted DNA-binding transcriptional regulator YafY
MRRADRLFQIIQVLRGAARPVTAQQLAAELEVTPRTVYRDVADLIGQRVPIRGEAGVGYILEAGYDMPPLMLTSNEIEAAVLGAQWVIERGDPTLARGARDLLAKIRAVAPPHLQPVVQQSAVIAPCLIPQEADTLDLERIRGSIYAGTKLAIDYRDREDQASQRIVWPLAVAYLQSVRMLVAWCELREGFRHFRTDRIERIEFLTERHGKSPQALWAAWRRQEQGRPLEPRSLRRQRPDEAAGELDPALQARV